MVIALITMLGYFHRQPARIAILKPILATVQIAGRELSSSPIEGAAHVIPKLAEEAKYKLHWKLDIVDYPESVAAEEQVIPQSTAASVPHLAQLHLIAKKLEVNLIAFYVVNDYTGSRVQSFPGGHITGKSSISLRVYEDSSRKLVWSDDVIDTSSAGPFTASIGERMEQSLFNALRKALEPFVQENKRKEVAMGASVYVATVKQVLSGGKKVLLDVAGSVGDLLTDVDGRTKIKITEALSNGAIAEVVSGSVSSGQVFKSDY